jgi:hypothetical protein
MIELTVEKWADSVREWAGFELEGKTGFEAGLISLCYWFSKECFKCCKHFILH